MPTPEERDASKRASPEQDASQAHPLCIWVLAGSPDWQLDGAFERLPPPDMIVVADGGSQLAAHLGLTPTLVIGDLDSADPDLIGVWEAQGVEMRRYEHTTKLETDTELAITAAVAWLGGRQGTIYLLNATGGRIDHSLANVLLLTQPGFDKEDIRLIEGRQEVFLAKPGSWNEVSGRAGELVTLLPVGGDAAGAVLEGFIYPLNHETLGRGRGRGVSNELASNKARLRFDSGLLLVVISHKEEG